MGPHALNPLAQSFRPMTPVVSTSANTSAKARPMHSAERRHRRNRPASHRAHANVQTKLTDEEQQSMYEWVCLMADLESLENEHLIEMALQHAPADKVHEIEAKYVA